MEPLVEYGTALVIGTSPCRKKGEGTEGIAAAVATITVIATVIIIATAATITTTIEDGLKEESFDGLHTHLVRYGLETVPLPGVISEDATTALRRLDAETITALGEQSAK
jgi:hypothetical protein